MSDEVWDFLDYEQEHEYGFSPASNYSIRALEKQLKRLNKFLRILVNQYINSIPADYSLNRAEPPQEERIE